MSDDNFNIKTIISGNTEIKTTISPVTEIKVNIIGTGPPGPMTEGFIHYQPIPSSIWEIEHNLGKYPSVSIVDDGNNLFFGDVKYINKNKIIIYLSGMNSGKAYLN